MVDMVKRKLILKDMKKKLVLFLLFFCVCVFFFFVFVRDYLDDGGHGGVIAGSVAGNFGSKMGYFFSDFGMYLSNIGVIGLILIGIIVVGGFIVLYLKNKFDLKFRWGSKKPKKYFN